MGEEGCETGEEEDADEIECSVALGLVAGKRRMTCHMRLCKPCQREEGRDVRVNSEYAVSVSCSDTVRAGASYGEVSRLQTSG